MDHETEDQYRKRTVRATAEITIECYADPVLFEPELTANLINYFRLNGPIPCEGSGVPGIHCHGCRFCESTSEAEIDVT